MATITEVQSDKHRYLVFDAASLPEGDGIHSVTNETPDGQPVETTIVRTAEGLHITQTMSGETEDQDWTLAQLAEYAASARLFAPDQELITVSDEFIEEHLDPELFAEFQHRLANPEVPTFEPMSVEALMAMLDDMEAGEMDEEGVA